MVTSLEVNTRGEEFLLQLEDSNKWNNVNMLTFLLKLFFRKLLLPILTPEMYNIFICWSKIDILYISVINMGLGTGELAEEQLEQGGHHVYVVPLGVVQL